MTSISWWKPMQAPAEHLNSQQQDSNLESFSWLVSLSNTTDMKWNCDNMKALLCKETAEG